jgi:hypothetical protein
MPIKQKKLSPDQARQILAVVKKVRADFAWLQDKVKSGGEEYFHPLDVEDLKKLTSGLNGLSIVRDARSVLKKDEFEHETGKAGLFAPPPEPKKPEEPTEEKPEEPGECPT